MESGGMGGAWSVSGTGTISMSGVYTAPKTPGTATVAYTEAGVTGRANVTSATAFIGLPRTVAIQMNPNSVPTKPYEKVFAANGNTVYATVIGPNDPTWNTAEEVDFYASTDAGRTFTGPTHYHTGDLTCAVLTVDAVSPNIVYFAFYTGHGDSTGNTGGTLRLAVSTDGAQTFPHEYVLADSYNSIVSLICPDVASPAKGTVIVSGGLGGGGNAAWIGTWRGTANGKTIGPIGTPGTMYNMGGTFTSTTETNMGSATGCDIYDDGSGGSPRLASNAIGHACIVFQHIQEAQCGALSNAVMVQCSSDSGATWTTPVKLTDNTIQNDVPVLAVSPAGYVAVVYQQNINSNAEAFIAISKDGGRTFHTVQYPTASWQGLDATGAGVELPAVRWETDEILWFSASMGDNSDLLLVDKTCDDGASWSGAVNAGPYRSTGLVQTANGMAAAGFLAPNETGGPALSLIPLW
jgi:hypothetical protein